MKKSRTEYDRKYFLKNKKKIQAYSKNYYKEYYKKNKDKLDARSIKYYFEHKGE